MVLQELWVQHTVDALRDSPVGLVRAVSVGGLLLLLWGTEPVDVEVNGLVHLHHV